MITDAAGAAIAMRLTDRSGQFREPIPIEVPPLSAGQSPDTGVLPFTAVNMYARAENFEEIYIKNVQIFPEIVTYQNLEMIPLAEFPDNWIRSERFDIPPQNL